MGATPPPSGAGSNLLEHDGAPVKKRVLFVCVENSCRSQMAEGYARTLGADVFEAWSAGSMPSGHVNEMAVAMMQEDGVDVSLQESKGLSELPAVTWDCVVTMGCGDACPSFPAKRRLDWALPDPKRMPPDGFRRVRDDIKARIRRLVMENA
jgi:protein-tyrosine-phosphatase